MNLKITVDFGKIEKAFEQAPDETTKQLRSGLEIAVRDIQEYASEHHRYTSRSNNLEREGIVTKVEGNTGVVKLNPSVPYAQFVHEGTRRHKIRRKHKRALRWPDGDNFRYAQSVDHPGTAPDQFLYEASKAQEKHIQEVLGCSVDEALRKAGL
ncbi:hypothetical protein [uncultured Phascolarctobacterium sp.]|uniref:hypothetical protein n=1 Tax=uncultured Phascolarctobacterium sp. TaxID=512296 RepID=UPI002601C3A0|nr:hypothetical protein [uncultured Phascolarctobacterium sp.]